MSHVLPWFDHFERTRYGTAVSIMYTLSWSSTAKSPSAPIVRWRASAGDGSSVNDFPFAEYQAGAGLPTVSAPVMYTAPLESTLIDGSPTAWRIPLPSAAPIGS